MGVENRDRIPTRAIRELFHRFVEDDESLGTGRILANAPFVKKVSSRPMGFPCLLVLCALNLGVCHGAPAAVPSKPNSRTTRLIEGWTVRVDDRLLASQNKEPGTRILKSLEGRLSDIGAVVRPDRLAKLRGITIVLDMTHGKLVPMQYHPGAAWLEENGYAADLVRCVHIPVASALVEPRQINVQPWCVLHELAHAYHDQVLGFDDARIRECYERYKASGHGDAALLISGGRVRHYALTDHKEFFAEMTEAYFGTNDFFPFNRAELMEAEPEIYELMKRTWGPVRTRVSGPPPEPDATNRE